MTDDVLVHRAGKVLTITLNRPAKRNAMTREMGETIAKSLDELDRLQDLSVAIITGAGGNFCAGMDLERFAAGEQASVPGRGFGGVTQSPPRKPLIAAVEGYALAGGFELVLACDLVVASRSAVFGLPEVKRGLVAKGGGLLRLSTHWPRPIAMELILTGDPLSAERAATLGLVSRLTATGEALETARELATKISANPPLAVTAAKEVVISADLWPPEERFQRQNAILEPIMTSEVAKEGARAFLERRPPRWRSQQAE